MKTGANPMRTDVNLRHWNLNYMIDQENKTGGWDSADAGKVTGHSEGLGLGETGHSGLCYKYG